MCMINETIVISYSVCNMGIKKIMEPSTHDILNSLQD